MKVGIDYERARRVGEHIRTAVRSIGVDPFTDPRLYPPKQASREEVTAYFLVMVAMDHRLSRPGRPYEGMVDGEFYHGADLLYRLGSKKFNEDPEFFTAARLASLTDREVEEWLSAPKPGGGTSRPPDVRLRAHLLRDLGRKLLSLYDGRASSLIDKSKSMLRGKSEYGFIDLLKTFKAYQDPLEKKPFLLAKFLERRGVVRFMDPWNKDVPVDNHLVRIAVRLGIVVVDEVTVERMSINDDFTWEEDVLLRTATRLAYRAVAASAGVDPFILDDFLWMFGRRCCTREYPTCRNGCRRACKAVGGCSEHGCVLSEVCAARRNPLLMVNEHRYLDTWYY